MAGGAFSLTYRPYVLRKTHYVLLIKAAQLGTASRGYFGGTWLRQWQCQGRARHFLRSQLESHMPSADFVQPFVHDPMRKFRPVTLTTEVAQVQMPELRRNDLLGGCGGGLVG